MTDQIAVTTASPSAGQHGGLRRILRRRDLILYGLVMLTPTAPYPVFGLVQRVSEGHAALSYLVAMVGMLFTAASYGKMSGAFPTAGSTYTYAQRSLSDHVGFLAGWAMILDYFLIPLLSVIYISITAERLLPAVPYLVWIVSFTLLITVINLRGIQMTARASQVMMFVMTACAVAFVVLAARWIMLHHGVAGLFEWQASPQGLPLRPLFLGAGIATLSYIGFDAISTLAEDTIDPEKDISVATVAVCVLQAIICVITVYLAARVWPDYHTYPQVETVILDIGREVGGAVLFQFITVVLLVAGLASSLTGQAGASRLLFAMGRDGVLPRRIFAHINEKSSTPDRAIYFMTALTLVGALFIDFQLSVELLNFGAFVGFILVNLGVVRHYFIRLKQRHGLDFFTNLVFPLSGAVVCTLVWLSLTSKAKLVGFVWLGAGILYLAVITRGFRSSVKSLSVS